MVQTDCAIVGAGQAGLAMSRCLADSGVDHVVLERGRVAERWRSERWDSLRLLTPNWQSRLPGFGYDGPDRDGFMTMPEVVGYFERYAASFNAPVREGVTVQAVTRDDEAFVLETSGGKWRARSVVVATGHSDTPWVPALAARFPGGLAHMVPTKYRRPDLLPDGGVLVVGASASGIQLADELHRAGRHVTLAVGQHLRMPRRYRGRDILWWLDRMGLFGESVDQVYDAEISREQPSLQLVGHPEHVSLDLAGLQARGVHVVGRLVDVNDGLVRFADDLVATTAAADFKMASLLRRIDAFIAREALETEAGEPFEPHCLGFVGADITLHLQEAGIRTVLWATGFRRHYPWLHLPVLDGRGEIRHTGGVTPETGLYVLGLHFMRRRNSAFIDGVGDDARALAEHVVGHLAQRRDAVA